MKASRRSTRCGVVDAYCFQTCWAISVAEALALRVAGPEESFGVAGVGVVTAEVVAEVVEAAWRFGAMLVCFWGGGRCNWLFGLRRGILEITP